MGMVGQTLSHYEILEKLGEGGMGVVYKARDTRLGRLVAIKVLPSGKTGDEKRRLRFFREAKAASALNHPNIVIVHDIATTEDGTDFIVMEFLPGTTLSHVIAGSPLPIATCVKYGIQIAEALATTHANAIIHRDLKPGNVLISDSGVVKVLDFGLAKLSQSTDAGDSTAEDAVTATEALTEAGVVMGTAAYMSPEQAVGEAVDAASDIFSLGIVLYEMVSGTLPFRGAHTAALIHAIHFDQPAALSTVRPEVPISLQRVIERCLQKKKEDRYAKAEQVALELRAVLCELESAPTSVLDPVSERVSPAAPRRKWLGPASAVAVLALVLVVAAPASRRQFSRLWAYTAGAANIAVAATPYDLMLEGRQHLRRYYRGENVNKATAAFQRALQADDRYAPAYAGMAAAFVRKFEATEEKMWAEQAKANAQRAIELDSDLAAGHVALGWAAFRLGEMAAADSAFRTAISAEPGNADAYRGLGHVARSRRESQKAEEYHRKSIELRKDDWENHVGLGVFLYGAARYQDAAEALARAAELAPDNHIVFKDLAGAYYMQGKIAESAAALQKSIEIQPTALVYSNLGTLYYFQGLYVRAVSAFEKATELGANSSLVWGNLGDAYRWTPGNESKAKDAYLRAIQLVRSDLAKDSNNPDLRSRLAAYLAKRGNAGDAVAELKALDQLPSKDPRVKFRTVLAWEAAGWREKALGALESALAAGYPQANIDKEPELAALRSDRRYHLITMKAQENARKK
jgi:eukaryotic-like serine/threonine-protein kinase